MKTISSLAMSLAVASAAGVVTPAVASPGSDALAQCLADNTTGRDRKDLARWVFVAIAAHPEMRSLSSVSPDQREASQRDAANLFMQLVTERCRAQSKAAAGEGANAIETAFAALGQLAMQELMNNAEVNASMSGVARYMDGEKLRPVLGTP